MTSLASLIWRKGRPITWRLRKSLDLVLDQHFAVFKALKQPAKTLAAVDGSR